MRKRASLNRPPNTHCFLLTLRQRKTFFSTEQTSEAIPVNMRRENEGFSRVKAVSKDLALWGDFPSECSNGSSLKPRTFRAFFDV